MIFQTKIGGAQDIERAAKWIQQGEIVAFPTETVYGLGGNALDESAVRKIYEAKNRPQDNPFIVHVADVSQAEEVAYVTEEAKKLFSLFSPGPLTVVLKKKPCVPNIVTSGLPTVGIRIPAHPLALAFLRACKCPVAAPSANTSKRVSPTSAQFVYDDMAGKIPLILDGGQCDVGIESTVVSLCEKNPIILRPGMITAERLRQVFPKTTTHKGEVAVAPSPGMKYKHYAPIVPCFLFNEEKKVKAAYAHCVEKGQQPVLLVKDKNLSLYKNLSVVGMGKDGAEIARNIFALLRECEKKFDTIFVEGLANDGEEGSVMNRLVKSCEGKIVE